MFEIFKFNFKIGVVKKLKKMNDYYNFVSNFRTRIGFENKFTQLNNVYILR